MFFHARFLGDINLNASQDREESKKKFFKFLETAEKYQEKKITVPETEQKETRQGIKFDDIKVEFAERFKHEEV